MRKAFKVVGLLVGAILVLGLSMGPSDLGRVLGDGWFRFSILVSITAVGCVVYSWQVYVKPLRSSPAKDEKFPFHRVNSDRVSALHEMIDNGGMATLAQARIFATAIVEPASIRRRVVEEYTPERRTLVQATRVDAFLPKRFWTCSTRENGDGVVFLPVVVVPKGVLLDGFCATGSNGENVSCLSYRDYLILVASTLRVLLVTAYGLRKGEQLPPNAVKAEFSALSAIIHRTPPCGHVTPDFSPADAIARLDAPTTTTRDMAAQFVRALITNYAVVGTVSPPLNGRLVFNWTQNYAPDLRLARSGRRWSVPWMMRIGLGAKPVDLTLDIATAGTAQSYHLHVHAPEGLYLARQEALGLGSLLVRQATDAPTLPHCRFRRRLGQPHAHFYSRYMPRVGDEEYPRLRFKFFEVPPGSIMRAAVTAIACAAIVWIVAFISSQHPGVDTDAPAFLLAFPALAATWLGFESPSQRLLEGTLSTRICLVLSAGLSIASSGLFMAHKAQAGTGFDWPKLPEGVTILGVTDLTWAFVTALALVNAAQISYKYGIQTWEYLRLISRPVD